MDAGARKQWRLLSISALSPLAGPLVGPELHCSVLSLMLTLIWFRPAVFSVRFSIKRLPLLSLSSIDEKEENCCATIFEVWKN